MAVTAVFLLSAAILVGTLQFTGVLDLGGLFVREQFYEYPVSDNETLLRYLTHSDLKSGDTLVVSGDLSVDVEQDMGGVAMLPLLNFTGNGSVRFVGGTVLMLGGEQDADLGAVRSEGCTIYVEAPNSPVQWSGCSDDSLVNCATLNGSAHARELDLVTVGSFVELQIPITNTSGSAQQNLSVSLSGGGHYAFPEGSTIAVEQLGAGETYTATVRALVTGAGRGRVYAAAFGAQGQQLAAGSSSYQTILGAGYYAGDPHTHSTVSEHGNLSSIQQNIAAAWQQGMSWIGSLENCLHAQKLSQQEVDGITGEAGAFHQFVGVENGEGLGDHHLVAYGTDVIPKSNYHVDPYNGKTWVLQDAVDEMIRSGGRVILPHFCTNYDLTESISLARSVRDVRLWELFYGGLEVGSMGYRVSVNLWNNLNVRGRERTFALGASNYGSADYIGSRFTVGYMTSPSDEQLLAMLDSGNFYVSNGPALSFRLGSADMGGEIGVSPDGGETAICRITASDDVPLTNIILYKYVVTGVIDNEIREEILNVDLTGQNLLSYETALDIQLDPAEECFYRLEVYSESCNLTMFGEEQGIAFSNPIWTVPGETGGDALFSAVEAKRGELVLTEGGSWLLTGVNRVNADALELTTRENARVSVTYHEVASEKFADYLTVRIIAEDGTIHTETIFVAE